jgi:phage gp36-like protein
MPYATVSDLEARYGIDELLAIMPGIPDQVDESKVLIALQDASDEADSYLSERYKTPIDNAPNILVATVCDIARYRYHSQQGSDEITERYKDRIRFLKSVVSGTAGLGIDETVTEYAPVNVAPKKTAVDRIFSRDSLNEY